ncbi:unnamed protein product [Plutella xylostella]|uniref:(diamondback moth) hypothetical protein n=1 Tax=Plutella xylostella TaxID=51655 RepID=A0A8S4E4B0_PLUXY|nr:unnamed protein product [Plutella xylostella]
MDAKTLKKNRGSVKAKLTIFKGHLEQLTPCTKLNTLQFRELSARLNRINELYKEFDSIQNNLETLSDTPEDEFKERQEFEAGYFSTVAAAQELLDRSVERPAPAGHDLAVAGSSTANDSGAFLPTLKLPTIHLPTFAGGYQDWLEFHDTYMSLIHLNDSIPKIQKYHYLRSSLRDNAALLIQSLDLSGDNYDVAWDLLCERYNNTKLLVNNHLKALFNLEPMFKESSTGRRNIIDSVNKNIRALKTLHLPTEHWDAIIIYVICTKLDHATLKDWEMQRGPNNAIPTFSEFNSFIKNRAAWLESIEENHQKLRRYSDTPPVRAKTFVANYSNSAHASGSNPSQNSYFCPICKQSHSIYECTKFRSMTIEGRMDKVKQLNLCQNCLRKGHDETHCWRGSCKICNQRHNSMIHLNHGEPNLDSNTKIDQCVVLPNVENLTNNTEPKQTTNQSSNTISLSVTHPSQAQVLLSTVIVSVADKNGKHHKVRALLDQGSTASFLTNDLLTQLQTPCYHTSVSVQGLNNQTSKISKRCDVSIASLSASGYTTDVNCFVVPQITQVIPMNKINCGNLKIPPHIYLADPTFAIPSEVQMLLGADIFWDILCNNRVSLGKAKPTLVETKLGWLVVGSIPTSYNTLGQHDTVHCNLINKIELEEKINKYFELESLPAQQSQSRNEAECEKLFLKTTVRNPDGRLVVTIPLKENPQCLGDSKQQALIRFNSLERKFSKNEAFKTKYINFMKEYIELGHMSENKTPQDDNESYFLPHHGVLREDSLTTKLRTVFDASAVTSTGKSFNDIQLIGPPVQDDLLSILIRFRQHKYVVTADVEKMYRQILVNESQRSLQQIFWRSDPSLELKQYKLNTITYGTASAPYLATRCLKQLGLESTNEDVREVIIHDFYVDDLNTGSDNEKTLIDNCKGVLEQLRGAQMNLRKWRCNKPELLLFSSTMKTNIRSAKSSKRIVLSMLAQIFDPLGLINPCTLKAKLILQTLWANNIPWDAELPTEVESQWNNFTNYISDLISIEIPRRVLCDSYVRLEMHAFSDASIKAYSACVYLRSVTMDGDVTVNLLLAKSRVAPLKQRLTIPRLELCGALLATRLAKKAKESLRLEIDVQHFWCDSTIVLSWIKTCKQTLKQFVCNRITEITNISEPNDWHHVPTELNPADIGSRGLNATQLKGSTLWWRGPHFLNQVDIQWPMQPQGMKLEELPEIKVQFKAVHLELVTDLSAKCFISALNRFVARRGKPSNIYSDNGTNFVGANHELRAFLKQCRKDVISYSAETEIKFHFSPAYSPHFNGMAEGSVKSIKYHLKRVLGLAHLDFEEMYTVLVQIEGILNSRPITPLSSDPSDLIPLTPSHFLIGRTCTMLPAAPVEDKPISSLTRFKRIEQLKAHFWNRFYKEYISELQQRNKWRTIGEQPQLGELVLVKDDRLPPNRWLLGRVTAVYPGTDGVNRVADVITRAGTLRRAYNRLCPLPLLEQTVPRGGPC